VYVEPGVLAAAAGAPAAEAIVITRPVLADTELQQATRRLLRVLRLWQQGEAGPLACEEALVQACGLVVLRHTTSRVAPDAGDGPLATVRERLSADLLAPPTLGELAALAGLSRFQLLRRFAAYYGCTPHAWLVQQRCERVRALVRRGVALAEAAAGAGFADQSHMTRIFTRQFGFTPGAWQRAQLQ
jgi:AraC-like DNA-binding protein